MTEERNFCPRCGKRRGGDANYIHTCTPPQPDLEWVETNNAACKILRQVHDMLALASVPPRKTWVGLTGVEINHIFAANVGYPERMMDEVEKLLKEKNNE